MGTAVDLGPGKTARQASGQSGSQPLRDLDPGSAAPLPGMGMLESDPTGGRHA